MVPRVSGGELDAAIANYSRYQVSIVHWLIKKPDKKKLLTSLETEDEESAAQANY